MRLIVKQRKKMWLENPHCRKCGVLTVLPEDLRCIIANGQKKIKEFPPNTATIQHIYSKLNPLRKDYSGQGVRTHYLWCKKCNEDEAKKEEAELPIEEIWKRCGAYPLSHNPQTPNQ